MRSDLGRDAKGPALLTGLVALEQSDYSRASATAVTDRMLGRLRKTPPGVTGLDGAACRGIAPPSRGGLCGGGNGQSPPDANDGEASQESDTFTEAKRPSNNGMKLTGSAMSKQPRPPQLIPVFYGYRDERGGHGSSLMMAFHALLTTLCSPPTATWGCGLER